LLSIFLECNKKDFVVTSGVEIVKLSTLFNTEKSGELFAPSLSELSYQRDISWSVCLYTHFTHYIWDLYCVSGWI
jgi:hypothetical protein